MATASRKAPCFTCGKEKGGVRCEGCSKIFCLNDFANHRQELNKELDEVEITRDLFRQTLTDKEAEPQKHTLIEHIDKWETKSINKIRQAAEEARQIVLKHTAGLYIEIEDRLTKLTNQLQQSRQENDFFETDLTMWQEELTQMNNELTQPSSIRIRQDSIALVAKINVDILDRSYQTNDSDDDTLISCEYCKKGIQWHLYDNHKKACQDEEHQRLLQKQSRSTNRDVVPTADTGTAPCMHCARPISLNGLPYHQLHCTLNIRRHKN